MALTQKAAELTQKFIVSKKHSNNNYFGLITKLVSERNKSETNSEEYLFWQKMIDEVYHSVADEIINNINPPVSGVKFGTSGWRGIIGKDFSLRSVSQVTLAIIDLYKNITESSEQSQALGVNSLEEAKERGCVIGFDNRFGNEMLARRVTDVLTGNGFIVHYAGESTTGALSAAVIELDAAFSINLTPSHNPLEYSGFKYNAADGGPAAPILTDQISARSNEIIANESLVNFTPNYNLVKEIHALDSWLAMVRKNINNHGLDYDQIIDKFSQSDDFVLIIDSVHGASRVDLGKFLKNNKSKNLQFLRINPDPTFGGIAPEPSPANLELLNEHLAKSSQPFKLGAIIDPDADRIRFTDGTNEINMNQFGAMAYHFLHEVKNKKGMVAKTVATSNFANSIATALNEKVFEPKVGFKEFKPVIGKALVCFEESDGITVKGHTSEKDAYIGLILAMDMIMTLNQNLNEYLHDLQKEFGYFFPDKDGIPVSQKGRELTKTLSSLDRYKAGRKLTVGASEKTIKEVITIDGHKIIFDDKSWLMIRPSGTEPKVRFYVEARNKKEKNDLFDTAKILLHDVELLDAKQ